MGVLVANNPTTTYAATVTMLNTVQVAASAPAATGSGAANSPPDPAGSEGDGRIATMVNGQYNVYSTTGQLLLSESLTKFWTNAGVTLTGTPFSSRMEYDSVLDRWIVVGARHEHY